MHPEAMLMLHSHAAGTESSCDAMMLLTAMDESLHNESSPKSMPPRIFKPTFLTGVSLVNPL